MIKKAMILAAGFGKRVRPLTLNCPKPLLKIGDQTLLSNTINFLEKFGIKKIVINTHHLAEKIYDYINKNNFKSEISLIQEKNNILDTGGGILNALSNFSNKPFLTINPDTIWNFNYLKELKKMENKFFAINKSKCFMLLVNKNKSFDQNINGDFSLKKNLINRKGKKDLKYIYTGLQIITPEVFTDINYKVFSINKIWNNLIENQELYGAESKINFLHVSTLGVYKNLLEKKF
jgi:MurNAc alpha-1-phosphate uridylyltransferase|tara:strand:+ start:546 stop:1247 length:702 start_codon:yes stop_codon:yes gene_type:complete